MAGTNIHGRKGFQKVLSLEERFWSKVVPAVPDECWGWSGWRNKNGYCRFDVTPTQHRAAHRIAWQLTFGVIPTGMIVCHKCDNRGCVNPSHMFIGTTKDNMLDASAKGRLGKSHHQRDNAQGEG